jgi:hypothetical protein
MPWTFNPFTGSFDQKGSGGGSSVLEGEVATFADLPQTAGTPPVGSSYLVRESTGVWLVNRRQAGIYIRTNNTGVRADDWSYGGDFPVQQVNGQTGAVVLDAGDVGAEASLEYINQSLASTSSVNLVANKHYTFTKDFAGNANLLLPTTANDGDRVVVRRGGGQSSGDLFIVRQGGSPFLQNIGVLTQPDTVFYAVWSGLWRQDFIPPAGFQGKPSSVASTAIAGQMAFEDPYLYIAVSTNTWRRVPVAAF